MMMRFLVFQHMPWEGPGTFLVRSADRLGVELSVVEVWHEPIPDLRSWNGIIVLGGGPNVDQEKEYPFLWAEKAAIRSALDRNMPFLGFCLGHQLLAAALGADVGPNVIRSVGFTQGLLTGSGRAHPVFEGLPESFPLFKWHGQAVLKPVPEKIEILATSPQCDVEAISVEGKPHVIGLQFDNHAAAEGDITRWIESDRVWLSEPPPVDTERLLSDARVHGELPGGQFDVLFENFIKLV